MSAAEPLCWCGRPMLARCSWRMNRLVPAVDDEVAVAVSDDGQRYRREYTGATCDLKLCSEHVNIAPPTGTLCSWHFMVAKEQGAIAADTPPCRARRHEEAFIAPGGPRATGA